MSKNKFKKNKFVIKNEPILRVDKNTINKNSASPSGEMGFLTNALHMTSIMSMMSKNNFRTGLALMQMEMAMESEKTALKFKREERIESDSTEEMSVPEYSIEDEDDSNSNSN